MNPDGASALAPEPFTIVSGGEGKLTLDLVGPSVVRAGRETKFSAVARNEGLVDSRPVLVEVTAQQATAHSTQSSQSAEPLFQLFQLFTAIPVLPPGTSKTIPIPVIFPSPDCGSVSGNAETVDSSGEQEQCIEDCLTGHSFCVSACQELPPDLREICIRQCDKDLATCITDICLASASLNPLAQIAETATPQQVSDSLTVCPVTSFDPNDKVGAAGPGDAGYVRGVNPLPYTVFFENVPAATAPAQEVVITDQLDANLDLSTFALDTIGFGNRTIEVPEAAQNFTTDVDLRPEKNLLVRIAAGLDNTTGLLTWRLTSVDPDTGQPPEDPLAGFLPPNGTPPEGEGRVTFTVIPNLNRVSQPGQRSETRRRSCSTRTRPLIRPRCSTPSITTSQQARSSP